MHLDGVGGGQRRIGKHAKAHALFGFGMVAWRSGQGVGGLGLALHDSVHGGERATGRAAGGGPAVGRDGCANAGVATTGQGDLLDLGHVAGAVQTGEFVHQRVACRDDLQIVHQARLLDQVVQTPLGIGVFDVAVVRLHKATGLEHQGVVARVMPKADFIGDVSGG